jgi:hypothetical protein
MEQVTHRDSVIVLILFLLVIVNALFVSMCPSDKSKDHGESQFHMSFGWIEKKK